MAARPQAEKVKLYPPNGGDFQMFSPENVNDMIRFHKWSRKPPAAPTPAPITAVRNVPANGDSMSAVLDALRAEAAGLGIRYDLTWGVARLKAEITKRETAGAVNVPATPEEIAAAEMKRMAEISAKQAAEDDEEAQLLAELEAEEAAARARDEQLGEQKDG